MIILFALYMHLDTVDYNHAHSRILLHVIKKLRLQETMKVGVRVINIPPAPPIPHRMPKVLRTFNHLIIQCSDSEVATAVTDELKACHFALDTCVVPIISYLTREEMGYHFEHQNLEFP